MSNSVLNITHHQASNGGHSYMEDFLKELSVGKCCVNISAFKGRNHKIHTYFTANKYLPNISFFLANIVIKSSG